MLLLKASFWWVNLERSNCQSAIVSTSFSTPWSLLWTHCPAMDRKYIFLQLAVHYLFPVCVMLSVACICVFLLLSCRRLTINTNKFRQAFENKKAWFLLVVFCKLMFSNVIIYGKIHQPLCSSRESVWHQQIWACGHKVKNVHVIFHKELDFDSFQVMEEIFVETHSFSICPLSFYKPSQPYLTLFVWPCWSSPIFFSPVWFALFV